MKQDKNTENIDSIENTENTEKNEKTEKTENTKILTPQDDGYISVLAGESEPPEDQEPEFVPYNPLERPKINYVKPIVAFIVYVAQFVALSFIPFGKWWITMLVLMAYSIVYFSFIAKRTVIWLVHLYQNKASDETRLRCTMEPSCSVYMILAVEKYGVIRGVYKGIRRLFRCGTVSGVDYP